MVLGALVEGRADELRDRLGRWTVTVDHPSRGLTSLQVSAGSSSGARRAAELLGVGVVQRVRPADETARALSRAERPSVRDVVRGAVARARVAEGVDALLEGFAAAAPAPDFPGKSYRAGDRVRVSVRGERSIVGRVVRPHGDSGRGPTHAVVAPEGGGPHVMAELEQVRLDTPKQHAQAQRREAAAAARAPGAQRMPVGVPKAKPAVQEGIGVMLEAFALPKPGTAAAAPSAIAKGPTAPASTSAAGWSAAKHPRAPGGKFGYTTGGKRATRAAPRAGAATSPRTLTAGSRGALVKSIQRQLGLPADGVYGPQTRGAVARYQAQHHLQVDGIVGAQTLAALRGHVNPQGVRPGPIASRAATIRTHPAARKARASAPPARYGGGLLV